MEPVHYASGLSLFLLPLLLFTTLAIIGVVILVKLLNARKTGQSENPAGTSATRVERMTLLRERRDRYEQERTRILGMVDGGQISGEEAALLLNTVERETSTMACPFCQQDIRIEALKCRHCGSYLIEEDLQPRKLTRSSNKMLAGVCAGIAEYSGMDVSLVRILVVLISLSTGIISGLLIYLVAALVMPDAD
jgi:phage shock protein PspC (stress-responsive transcriptional regulator)